MLHVELFRIATQGDVGLFGRTCRAAF